MDFQPAVIAHRADRYLARSRQGPGAGFHRSGDAGAEAARRHGARRERARATSPPRICFPSRNVTGGPRGGPGRILRHQPSAGRRHPSHLDARLHQFAGRSEATGCACRCFSNIAAKWCRRFRSRRSCSGCAPRRGMSKSSSGRRFFCLTDGKFRSTRRHGHDQSGRWRERAPAHLESTAARGAGTREPSAAIDQRRRISRTKSCSCAIADDPLQPPNVFSTAIATIQNNAYVRPARSDCGLADHPAGGLIRLFSLDESRKTNLVLVAIALQRRLQPACSRGSFQNHLWLPTFLPLALLWFLVSLG